VKLDWDSKDKQQTNNLYRHNYQKKQDTEICCFQFCTSGPFLDVRIVYLLTTAFMHGHALQGQHKGNLKFHLGN
jgi:hypothetical protein